jgi:LPXTG-motif cell wall-anchored protein
LRLSLSRRLVHVGLAAVVGMVATTAFASPAAAAAAGDLSISFTGTTIAALSGGKFGKVTIRNDGPGTPTGVEVTFDISALDTTKVQFSVVTGCVLAGDEITCSIDDEDVPPPGGENEFPIPLERQLGASGAAGSATATVSSAETDPNTGNNSTTANVNVGDSGVDVQVIALDVYALDSGGFSTTDPVPPGGSSDLDVIFFNFGDLAVAGLRVTVSLPEHVTFATSDAGCTYSADGRQAECLFPGIVLPTPGIFALPFPVNVSASAPGPVALQGGLVTAEALGVEEQEVPEARNLPKNMRRVNQADLPPDVDPSDNEDPFAVHVGADLPVTGFKAGLYAMSGAGLLLLGALIVVLARRRRAVTPA